jgi:hypothetical protein
MNRGKKGFGKSYPGRLNVIIDPRILQLTRHLAKGIKLPLRKLVGRALAQLVDELDRCAWNQNKDGVQQALFNAKTYLNRMTRPEEDNALKLLDKIIENLPPEAKTESNIVENKDGNI